MYAGAVVIRCIVKSNFKAVSILNKIKTSKTMKRANFLKVLIENDSWKDYGASWP